MRPSGNQLGVRQHLRDRKAHPESIQSPIAMNSDRAAMNFGLAIVKAIAEAHGGVVGVESGAGRTIFWICLPAR